MPVLHSFHTTDDYDEIVLFKELNPNHQCVGWESGHPGPGHAGPRVGSYSATMANRQTQAGGH